MLLSDIASQTRKIASQIREYIDEFVSRFNRLFQKNGCRTNYYKPLLSMCRFVLSLLIVRLKKVFYGRIIYNRTKS